MSVDFLSPAGAVAPPGDGRPPLARSPVEREMRAAGARFEARDGWHVATAYASPEREADTLRSTVGWADVSHLAKIQVQSADLPAVLSAAGGPALEPGLAVRAAGAWWCPVTGEKALVICEPSRLEPLRDALAEPTAGTTVLDLTSAWGALAVAGPQARETFARFCALDLRPASMPVRGFRPGSVARTPGFVLREAEDSFLALFGWAVARYVWTVVADAGQSLGGAAVGVDALTSPEDGAHA